MKRPASQYYWGDWRRDTALQSCSLAARGMWHEMNCLMHDCEPYGHLMVGAAPMQPAQLARLVGVTLKECLALLRELEAAGVFSRKTDGTIFSRRMVRDEDLRERRASGGQAGAQHGSKGAEHGSKGGRPPKRNPPSMAPEGGSETPLHPTKEPPPASASASAVEVSVEADASTSSPGATDAGPETPSIPCPYGAIVGLYHEALPMLPMVRVMTADRERAMRKRWAWVLSSKRPDRTRRATNADEALAWFAGYFALAAANDFVNGTTPRGKGHEGWDADIDYLLTDRGMRRVIEHTEAAA